MVSYGGKDLQKRKVLSLEWKSGGVMDDESGESMEPVEQVPLIPHTTGWGRIGEISAWLTEGSRELIPEMRGSILVSAIVSLRFTDSSAPAIFSECLVPPVN